MKVMVFGSFDKLHEGHKALFAQAHKHGDVYAVVARDESIRRLKKREPRQPEEERLVAVAAEKDVHFAQLGHPTDFFTSVEEHQPELILLGYDQSTFSLEKIKDELKKRGISAKVKRANSFEPETYKSSLLH